MLNSTTHNGITYTLGYLSHDATLEVLDGNRLLLWKDNREEIASTVHLDGRAYVSAPLEPTLYAAVRFPSASAQFNNLAELVNQLGEALGPYCVPLASRSS
jgi:hypothetical protein